MKTHQRIQATFALLLILVTSYGQSLDLFTRMTSHGKIPSIFVEHLQDKID